MDFTKAKTFKGAFKDNIAWLKSVVEYAKSQKHKVILMIRVNS